jgi:hypothetical protein
MRGWVRSQRSQLVGIDVGMSKVSRDPRYKARILFGRGDGRIPEGMIDYWSPVIISKVSFCIEMPSTPAI